ncbi:MAG: redox-regulated ATPase YchF, partial [Actinobacteria bacterium]
MGITCGIVGLPNVGKSTLFNALTRAGASAENYPFCTIDPNVGIAPVPDPRLDRIAELVRPAAVVPTVVQFTDIAGLVAGASQGEGLGNQFLHHIRETDAIAHVVRCFDDPNVAHISGRVDPVADIDIINTELALADLDSVARAIERTERRARAGDKDAAAAMALVERLEAHLASGAPARTLEVEPAERIPMRDLFLLTAKPMVYVANVAEDQLAAGVPAVAAKAEADGADLVVFSGVIEAELALLDPADRSELLTEYGLEEPG